MTGLIETDVGTAKKTEKTESDELYIIDVDGAIAMREREQFGEEYGKIKEGGSMRASYSVGSTRSFTISSYSPGGSSITFKVLAVGEHCYIWTPSTNSTNYYTLDSINPDYAQQAADEFDRMYDLMNSMVSAEKETNNLRDFKAYIEAEGSIHNANGEMLLRELGAICARLKLIGSY